MKIFIQTIGTFLLVISTNLQGAFMQPTPATRVAKSELIAIVEALESNTQTEKSEVKVVQYLKGETKAAKITIWREKHGNGEIAGRNPWLQKGEKYLIFLKRNKNGKLVTTVSSNCSRKFTGEKLGLHYGHELRDAKNEIDKVKTIIQSQRKD